MTGCKSRDILWIETESVNHPYWFLIFRTITIYNLTAIPGGCGGAGGTELNPRVAIFMEKNTADRHIRKFSEYRIIKTTESYYLVSILYSLQRVLEVEVYGALSYIWSISKE